MQIYRVTNRNTGNITYCLKLKYVSLMTGISYTRLYRMLAGIGKHRDWVVSMCEGRNINLGKMWWPEEMLDDEENDMEV